MNKKSIHLEYDIYIKLNEIKNNLHKVGIEKTLYQINDIALRYGIDNTLEIIEHDKVNINDKL